jgi:hypothetical protein
MALTSELRAQAYDIREQIKVVLDYHPDAVNTVILDSYEDDKIKLTRQKAINDETQVLVKNPTSSSSASSGSSASSVAATTTKVFAATRDGILTFRHTARWVTYLQELADEAQAIADEEAAAVVDQFSTIDDEDIFPELSPGIYQFDEATLKATPMLREIEMESPLPPATTLEEVAPPESPAQTGSNVEGTNKVKTINK